MKILRNNLVDNEEEKSVLSSEVGLRGLTFQDFDSSMVLTQSFISRRVTFLTILISCSCCMCQKIEKFHDLFIIECDE